MRILIFGPNGSGKGTQSAILTKRTRLTHIESGGIFRENAKNGTDLGKQAKQYTEQGKLVPDSITIPMITERLQRDDCQEGWILDGFPRNPSQAKALLKALVESRKPLDAVIVIKMQRELAKSRLLGRASCPNGHPNNSAIAAIAPVIREGVNYCAQCGEKVTIRKDDIDEHAINVRLNIYFDNENGTVAAINAIEDWVSTHPETRFIEIDGSQSIGEVSAEISQFIRP